jgi:hypothetical protein
MILHLLIVVLLMSTVSSMSPSCNVADYGAEGNNKTEDTKAIQAAVEACQGGATGKKPLRGFALTV